MNSETPDYYATLEVGWGASDRELRAAYRRLIRIHHPDKNNGNEKAATAKFQEIREAFETLGNPEKRRTYNRSHGCRSKWSHQSTTPSKEQRKDANGYSQWNKTATTATTPSNYSNTEENSHSWSGNHWSPGHVKTRGQVKHKFSEMLRQRQEEENWKTWGRTRATEWFGARVWQHHNPYATTIPYDARSTWIPVYHYPPPLMHSRPRADCHQRNYFWGQSGPTYNPVYFNLRQPTPWAVGSCLGCNRDVGLMGGWVGGNLTLYNASAL
ncbi:DnaJ domain-containing protein [Nemania serpens]|nr:DnaJ domain-containing protein [Nemania serpens]